MTKKVRKFVDEFRKFALRGNVVDLSVGVLIGGAFTGITKSLSDDIIMPLVGMFIGGIDFSALNIPLPALFVGGKPGTLNLGIFLQTSVTFVIMAFVVFLFVKTMNKFRDKMELTAATTAQTPSKTELLLTEIRDLLREQADRR